MRNLPVFFAIILFLLGPCCASEQSLTDEMDYEYQHRAPISIQRFAWFMEQQMQFDPNRVLINSHPNCNWLFTYFHIALSCDTPILEAFYCHIFYRDEEAFYQYLYENPDIELEVEPELRHVLVCLSKLLYQKQYSLCDKRLSFLPAYMNIFKNLKRLNLSCNEINDLTPLVQLQNLEALDIGGNPVEDLSPLTSLGNLKSLMMYGESAVKDYMVLGQMQQLESLCLAGRKRGLTHFAFLKSLTKLKSLDVRGTNFTDSYSLSNCKELERLNISRTRFDRLACLPYLPNLKEVVMIGTSCADTTRKRRYIARRFSPSVALSFDNSLDAAPGTWGYFALFGHMYDFFTWDRTVN